MASKAFAGMTPFDRKIERFDDYVERLDHFFKANDIKENKASHLISCLDPTTYRLLKGQVAPDKVSDKSYDELVKVLKDHYCEKPNEIAERRKFYRCRNQLENETVAEFAAELRQMSIECNFKGPQLDEALRDAFVFGIKSESCRKKLYQIKDPTFKSVVEMAQMVETADKNMRELNSNSATATAAVHKFRTSGSGGSRKGKNFSRPTSNTNSGKCNRCGENHNPAQCKSVA
jgi:hypothetical protein